MSCISVRNASGINPDCVKYIEAAGNIIILKAGKTFPSVGDFQSTEQWRVAIQEEISAYIPVGIKGYEATSGELNKETSDFDGSSRVTYEGAPALILDIQTNPCDWNEQMAQYTGGGFDVAFISKITGDIMASIKPDGSVKGFLGNVYAQAPTLRAQGESFQSYKLSIDFQNVSEFRSFGLIEMPFNPAVELVDRMPLGLTMKATSTYAASDITVFVSERCGDPYTGTLVIEEVKSNIGNFSSSVVNVGDGVYTLTLEKDVAPVTLVPNDWVKIRAATKTGNVYDYVSGELTINA